MNKILLLFPALLMLTAGCEKQPNRVSSANGDRFTVDAIYIRNKPHEVIRDGSVYMNGGIMHSPECWCGKEVAR